MPGEEAVIIRSDFLIHWTGARDIEVEYKKNQDKQARIRAYVDRLRGTLAEGLWMNRVKEPLTEMLGKFNNAMTCFTEIKLSLVHEHTKRYGCLGFGFSRDFVMERGGAPVIYVSGLQDDITQQFIRQIIILAHLREIPDIMKAVEQSDYLLRMQNYLQSINAMKLFTPRFRLHLLERLQWCAQGSRDVFYDIIQSIANNVLFVKFMSEKTSPYDYKYLDESEWRIPYTPTHIEYFTSVGKEKPYAKIPFTPQHLKVLIFPDNETRQMAFKNEVIREWFGEPPEFPVMATVKDCSHF